MPVTQNMAYFCPRIFLVILSNSTGPDRMLHLGATHLDLIVCNCTLLIVSNQRWVNPFHSDGLSHTYRILGECLLISSLPGKALRMLVDIARLAEI